MLDHPGLLPVVDWGIREDRAYVVTGPHGRTISEFIQSAGPMEEPEALEFTAALADALAYLHERGLVYQTVDPGSAQLGPDGRTGQLAWPMFCVERGTPAVTPEGVWQRVWVPKWAAPEAFGKKGTVLPAVDTYGLGEILYYLLTGSPAFDRGRPEHILAAKLEGTPAVREKNPVVTGPTVRLLGELLHPDQVRRPSSETVRDQLRRIAERLRGAA